MRWRHRLVLRDQRRQKKTQSKQKNESQENESSHHEAVPLQKEKTVIFEQNENKKLNMFDLLAVNSKSLHQSQASNKTVYAETSNKLLAQHKRTPANEAKTHLPHLPFPLLTFEFLDRDIVKEKHSNHNNRQKRGMTLTETSYVVEFSKTKTPATPQVTLHEETTPDINDPHSHLETPQSIYFEQYAAMTLNKRRITELSAMDASFATLKHQGTERSASPDMIAKMATDSFQQTHTLTTLTDRQKSDATSDFSLGKRTSVSKSERSSKLKQNITPFLSHMNNPSGKSAEELSHFMLGQSVLKEESENFADEKEESMVIFNSSMDKDEHDDLSKYAKIDVQIDENDSGAKSSNMFKMIDRLNVVNVVEEKDETERSQHKGTDTASKKMRNEVTFGGWFHDDDAFELYDEEWTEEFMSKKRLHFDRFITLSHDVNVSFEARGAMQKFFDTYGTVKLFRRADVAEYDIAFECAWKDVWQNLNDSLRRFHHSKFYQEWLESNAANGLNVMPMVA